MIEWNKKYNLNISIIDVDHKKFVNIVNKAIVAKQGDNSPEEIQEVLNEMIDYAWNHFKTKETHMLKFKYPDYNQYKKVDIERNSIVRALVKAGWNKAKAARLLGIGRTTLYAKIEKYQITESCTE